VAVYTVLTPELLAEALARFGLPAPGRVLPEPKGYVNTNHHLWAGGERYFLRLAEGRDEADVLFEAEVMRDNRRMVDMFRASGFPVDVRADRGSQLVQFPTSLSPAA